MGMFSIGERRVVVKRQDQRRQQQHNLPREGEFEVGGDLESIFSALGVDPAAIGREVRQRRRENDVAFCSSK